MSHLEPFKYSPLPPGYIRLLHVSPLHGLADILTCKLKVFSLDARPKFEALSYAWGTQIASERIVCNNAKISLTPHLLEGLRNISTTMFVQWLWIDAICINQSDMIEKASQVMQMWQIYSAASRVVVWMGPSRITNKVMSAIRVVSKDVDEDGTLVGKSVEDMDRITSQLRAWEDELAELFNTPWFERLWVVQEVLLAQKTVALYGIQSISLASVLQLGSTVNATGLALRNLSNREPLAACSYFLYLARSRRQQLENGSAVLLLRLVRRKQTTDPLDRVYAILGLLEGHVRENMFIDYSHTSKEKHWKAYTHFCRLILQEYGESYLSHLSVADRSLALPSWCLNLNVKASNWEIRNLLRGAGIDTKVNETEARRGVALSGSGLALHLQAYQVDMIERAVLVHPLDSNHDYLNNTHLGKHLSFVSSCYDLVLEMARSAGKKPLTSLAKVLVGGVYSTVSHVENYSSYEADEALRSSLEVWTNSELDYDDKVDLLESGSNWRYVRSSDDACRGRSLSLAMSGRLVLMPGDVQEGDIIVVIKGFIFPYALHPVPGEGETDVHAYRILGPCYVEDIMDGEVLKSEEFKSTGWAGFTII